MALMQPHEMRSLGTKCYGCGAAKSSLTKPLLKCSGCRVMTYCSKNCQASNWKEHKPFCKFLQTCPECFSIDYEGFAYRRYQVYEATKDISDEATRNRIEMTFTKDLLEENYQDLISPGSTAGDSYFGFGSLASFKESLLMAPDLGHSKQGQSIAFMEVPQAPLMLFRCCYELLHKYLLSPSRNKLCHIIVRDFFRILSQMLCYKQAALLFGRLLEQDLPSMPKDRNQLKQSLFRLNPPDRNASMLRMLIAFMKDLDDVADDIEGLAWQSLALVEIYIEQDRGNTSTIVKDTLYQIQLAGEKAHVVTALFLAAKKFAVDSLIH
jgi:hypothetical protein